MIDPDIAGAELDSFSFPLERSKLRELAFALGETDPIWHEEDAARDAGFAQVPLPPTVTVLGDHWRAGGAMAAAAAIGADLERVLHGEARWELLGPFSAGDELTASARVGAVSQREGKRGGAMTLVSVHTDYADQHGRLVARRTDLLIERGAAA
jgi:N-terminal half of MaoC dehydratase